MTVQKEPSGRRSVRVEVEVPGTPEEVWAAIATGRGVSSWFVPTELEHDTQGTPTQVVSHFGPGMDAVASVTRWDPPHVFAAESELGPGGPTLATEWIVEARGGGVCVVRVVHSVFASGDEWDGQLESTEAGWPAFFRILRLYLRHFRGQPCASFQLLGAAPGPASEAWARLTGALGLDGAAVGGSVHSAADAPPLAGLVEQVGAGGDHAELLLRLDRPAPGLAHLFALPMGERVHLIARLYLYGTEAAAAAQRAEADWRPWLDARFPQPSEAAPETSSAPAS